MTITIVPRHAPSIQPDDVWLKIGDWLQRHQATIRSVQWTMVLVYCVLLIVPVFLPLPDRAVYLWTNFTRFAQFIFWGVWWPLVLLTTALVGRIWCGILCPEGAITEFAGGHGRGRAIPRWLMWPGWPTLAFACTTLYGQMTSVYQYPAPTLLILGGSTLAAALIGLLYGRNKRVWCRYLCPVSGVFGLLAKLAPLHFRVDPPLWQLSQLSGTKPKAINCAPLVPIRTMRGASDCHMCGRCSGFRGAIRLARRSPNHEIVHVAGAAAKPWETILIVFGLMGLAVGAFQWSVSPWFVYAKQWMAEWLIENGITWPLEATAPWWVLTNYPQKNDVMTLLDGALLVAYLLAAALACGATTLSLLALAARSLGPWRTQRFHHLAQSLIPLAGAGVFLGLSGLTVSQLRSDGIVLPFVDLLRLATLAMATFWSGVLCWQMTGTYSQQPARRVLALSLVGLAMTPAVAEWVLLFWIW
ncbi:4Fe-4S binding protein [Mesorhizobium sp.]|uniref:4Fe-4S binding protein n=1 Tax=Mesorhizobium sp. TaxID=1871066 RepID=UPI000FE9911D|nr:4Fe-4S binding protein [Mesorhizobium sp.]RWM39469.1 MAG: 4Fe-4S binding protein [Mesorhizobium sp.]TJV52524.1 MAG: 4Fe-4S binding protein [Mesorhizobium sp.]